MAALASLWNPRAATEQAQGQPKGIPTGKSRKVRSPQLIFIIVGIPQNTKGIGK